MKSIKLDFSHRCALNFSLRKFLLSLISIGRNAASFAGGPVEIYTAHRFYFHENMPRWKQVGSPWMERFLGRLMHLLFSQSSEDMISGGMMPARRVLASEDGVGAAVFTRSLSANRRSGREVLGMPDDTLVIWMIGQQVQDKGFVEFSPSFPLDHQCHKDMRNMEA